MTRHLGKLLPISVLLVLLPAGPATAQGYGGSPSPSPSPSPAGARVQTTTPCSTIIVQGDNWGEAFVTIDREFDNPGCPGEGDPPDIGNEPVGGQNANNAFAQGDGVTVIPVDEDGSFSAALTVPRDTAPGLLVLRITGTDSRGDPREETARYEVLPAGEFAAAGAFDGGRSTVPVLLIAMLAVAAALGANQVRASRSRR